MQRITSRVIGPGSTFRGAPPPPVEGGDGKTLLHVDLDCFFVSVERVLDPTLAQRPVVVGGSAESRGVVCSASREAREMGVQSGMPTAIARRLCPEATFLPGRGRLYARAAGAAQKLLREFSPHVERASIDEAYLDITSCEQAPLDTALAIQRALQLRLGLPSSLGVGSNKLIAKVACQRAKPEGVLEVWPGYERAFLAPLPVAELPGVGPVLAERLRLFGLVTVDDLSRVDGRLLEATFGAVGRRLAQRSHGIGEDQVAEDERPRSISRERTFPRDVTASTDLIEALYGLSGDVSSRLRTAGLRGRTVTLKLRDAAFRTVTRARTLRVPTDDAGEIAGIACFLLREAHAGDPLRLVGVSVSGLEDEPVQGNLFAESGQVQRLLETSPEVRAPAGPIEGDTRPRKGLTIRWRAVPRV